MSEFIGKAFSWILTTLAEATTFVVRTAEYWFGIGGAILAIILIAWLVRKQR